MPNPNKLINFNMSALARDFNVRSSTIKEWIDTGRISNTTLKRIAMITSNLLKYHITPEMLLNEDISQLTFPSKVKDTEALYGLDKQIFQMLDTYPELKPLVLALLQTYDRK